MSRERKEVIQMVTTYSRETEQTLRVMREVLAGMLEMATPPGMNQAA